MSKRYYTKVIGGHSLPKAPTSIEERPTYIIKVHQSWNYGPRARFWDIMRWQESDRYEEGGYWREACRGGLAYTESGMWRSINRRLKKMKIGSKVNYYNLNKEKIDLN